MKKFKIFTAIALSALMIVPFAACGGESGGGNDGETEGAALSEVATSASMVVSAYEWGPAVDKVIVEFSGTVSGTLSTSTFTVKTASTKRTVNDVYYSDGEGDKVTSDSKYIAIELAAEYSSSSNSAVSSPFSYGWTTGRNTWVTSYKLGLTLAEDAALTVGGASVASGTTTIEMIDNKIVPETAVFDKDSYTYTGNVAITGTTSSITLNRAAYTPDGAASDGGKNPLIIWLHGAGEGGDDIDIDLLGNEVTALTKSDIQSYFTDSSSSGAYVLAVQTPTIWMDVDGTGTYNTSTAEGQTQDSYYTEALYAAITDYVNSNSDIDTTRIYIGGCSNGGYMTMNMMFNYGDYFAAYYPICEAYMNSCISDEMIAQIKDYNIWFLQSENDPTVDPTSTTIPTYYRLLEAGAQNVHLTLTATVTGTDSDATYNGHWSWIYAFNDAVKTEFDNDAILANGQDYITNTNCTQSASYWQWISQQTTSSSAAEPSGTTYTFEAEDAALATGEGLEDSLKASMGEYYSDAYLVYYQTAVEEQESASGGKSVGYFSYAGNTITFTITAEEAVTGATLTLCAASSTTYYDWSTYEAGISETAGANVGLTVNGTSVTLSGTLPSSVAEFDSATYSYTYNYYNWGTLTATIDLVQGENVIVLTCLSDGATTYGINVDYISISSTASLA